MTLATLFSGIGAPEFAAREVFSEAKTIFACEIDKFARQSYLANHEAPAAFYEDVCNLDARAYAGQIDILIGGSPCQDFSIAGQRAGENGERGNLIWQFYRVVSEARPSVFVYENVKGFLSINGGKSYQRFLDALRGLGYYCHAEILNTKDYGIPQNRERLYIVGFLNADEYHAFSYAPKRPLRLNLGDMLDAEVGEKYFLSDKMIACLKKKESAMDNFIKVVGKLDIKGNDIIKRVYATDGVAPTIHTAQGGNQEPKILQRARGFNKGNEFELCPTISSSSFEQNNLLKSESIRKLTPRECLRLQGFPESFKIVVSDTQAYKQAGNAMSVNVVKMILEQIKLAKNKEFRLGA
ncbi:DNA (cytosine-5-)-methyltransferase [uncultured Campylobacter sp.]|uniref:DNA cytosine methyltransferase n=1 Tax=uncultured Campylobacter sp. TaxID=218934 RepID=UPI0028EE746E|nr:DNA (cytosine-5-)-methyltransferase [uncultured Campylobacter sp.]